MAAQSGRPGVSYLVFLVLGFAVNRIVVARSGRGA
jgi:hypothetical protein